MGLLVLLERGRLRDAGDARACVMPETAFVVEPEPRLPNQSSLVILDLFGVKLCTQHTDSAVPKELRALLKLRPKQCSTIDLF